MKCDAGEFKAKPKGSKEFWSNFNPSDYLGNWATIEFETYSKAGIPLKPIFISLRDCDENGNPKEQVMKHIFSIGDIVSISKEEVESNGANLDIDFNNGLFEVISRLNIGDPAYNLRIVRKLNNHY